MDPPFPGRRVGHDVSQEAQLNELATLRAACGPQQVLEQLLTPPLPGGGGTVPPLSRPPPGQQTGEWAGPVLASELLPFLPPDLLMQQPGLSALGPLDALGLPPGLLAAEPPLQQLPPEHSLRQYAQQQQQQHYAQQPPQHQRYTQQPPPQQPQEEAQLRRQLQKQQLDAAQPSQSARHPPGGASAASSQKQAQALDREAKMARARQKNREAQQRFRERQRAKLAEANLEYDKLSEEVERLRLENTALARQNRIMEKVLTVRDAMMRAFDEAKLVASGQQLAGADGESAEGLMYAIEDLPTQEDMDAFASSSDASRSAAQQAAQQQPASDATSRGRATADGGGAAPGDDPQQLPGTDLLGQAGQPPAGSTWAVMRSASARSVEIDGSVLTRAGSIPPANNHECVQRIQAMTGAQDLIDCWRQWQVEISRICEAGEAGGWRSQSLEEASQAYDDIAQLWWHGAQLRPGYLIQLIENGSRKNAAAEDDVSRSIAVRMGPEIGEEARRGMRRAWQLYMKRLAKAAIGMGRWVQRLHQIATPTHVPSMRSVASGAVEVIEITRHMRTAVEEEYLASMEFLANLANALTPKQKLMINYMAIPFLPDWVSITYHILRQDPGELVAITLPHAQAVAGSPAPAAGWQHAGPALGAGAQQAGVPSQPGDGWAGLQL